MIVYLLRHGAPVGGRMYRGNLIDDPLTEEGWNQMKSSLKGLSFDCIATSPMKRCSEFAHFVSAKTNTPCNIIEDFKEIGFGDWQGKTSNEIGEKIVQKFKKNPISHPINNAENLYDFQSRVLTNFIELTQKNNSKDNCLIVAHAGVIRVIKSYILGWQIEKIFLIEIKSGSLESFKI